jgi:glucose/arabinose dehydrogenase
MEATHVIDSDSSRRHLAAGALVLLLTLAPGCSTGGGGGQVRFSGTRPVNPADVSVPSGYRVEAVAQGLTFPTGVAFDDAGNVYVVEAGHAWGGKWGTPRLLRVEPDGTTTVIATGDNPPWNGVDFYNGAFYVAEGGHKNGGRILRIPRDGGKPEVVVDNLPSLGDHHTNGPVVGPDGYLYFGQGSATNSGVVGPDNVEWLHRNPTFHDIPARDVTLAGRNFTTHNPLTSDPKDGAQTGAFLPFNTPSFEGQVIKGQTLCTGAVLRIRAEGGDPEVVAWGLRSPFGLAFSARGTLYITENGYDDRGSRRVERANDLLWGIAPEERGLWFGWPDYQAGLPVRTTDDPQVAVHGGHPFLLVEHPNDPPAPAAKFDPHAAAGGIDFSRHLGFGYAGEAFVAQFGDLAPVTGDVASPAGFKVVRVNVYTGTVHDFAANRGNAGPASRLKRGGFERPLAVRFSPDGESLYVVDFGVVTTGSQGVNARQGTGVLWRIVPEEQVGN